MCHAEQHDTVQRTHCGRATSQNACLQSHAPVPVGTQPRPQTPPRQACRTDRQKNDLWRRCCACAAMRLAHLHTLRLAGVAGLVVACQHDWAMLGHQHSPRVAHMRDVDARALHNGDGGGAAARFLRACPVKVRLVYLQDR